MTTLERSIHQFEEGHEEILAQTESLSSAVTRLQYEGKVNSGRNLKEIEDVLHFLKHKLIPHMKKEDMVFNLLGNEIPKLEPVFRILFAEHKELKVNLEVLSFLLDELEEKKNGSRRVQILEKFKDKVTYLLYLMRHHIQVEDESVFKVVDAQMTPSRREELEKQLAALERKSC